MRTIQLEAIYIDGFKSFHKNTHVYFTGRAGLNYLSGRNEAEPRLAENGAGKSSLWDALFWCLYGVSVLGKPTGSLTSWGAKRANVTCIFNINGDTVCIERIGSPERINIGEGENVDPTPGAQKDIDRIMGLGRTRFQQSVIFGQSMPMFYDLDIPARGKLLDDTLDLSIWKFAADEASERKGEENAIVKAAEQAKAFAEGKMAGIADPAQIALLSAEWLKDLEAHIDTLVEDADKSDATCAKLQKALDEKLKAHAALGKPDRTSRDKFAELLEGYKKEVSTLEADLRHARNHVELFRRGEAHCPSCDQEISEEYAAEVLEEFEEQEKIKQAKLAEWQADIEYASTELLRVQKEGDAIIQEAARLVEEGSQLRADLNAEEKYLERVLEAIDDQTKKKASNPYAAQLQDAEAARKAAGAEVRQKAAEAEKHAGRAALYDRWASTEYKKVRLFIIKRILLQLELDVSNAASLLGIGGWGIRISTETATKGGDLKHGVQVIITSPASGDAVAMLPSGGEGQRIRLAINMGLSSLIQRMAGVRYGFEVWDEQSDGLSDSGISDLLDCLRYRAQMTQKTIWITDHRTFSYNFDEEWVAVKTVDGTTLEKVKGNE